MHRLCLQRGPNLSGQSPWRVDEHSYKARTCSKHMPIAQMQAKMSCPKQAISWTARLKGPDPVSANGRQDRLLAFGVESGCPKNCLEWQVRQSARTRIET